MRSIMQIAEVGSTEDKEMTLFALLLISSILCGIIHDVFNKYVYTWRKVLIFTLWVDKGWGARKNDEQIYSKKQEATE